MKKRKKVSITIRFPEASLGYRIILKKIRGKKTLTMAMTEDTLEWSLLKHIVEKGVKKLYKPLTISNK